MALFSNMSNAPLFDYSVVFSTFDVRSWSLIKFPSAETLEDDACYSLLA